MVSQYTLIQDFAQRTYGGSGRLPVVNGKTTARGTALTLQDQREVQFKDSDANLLDGVHVYWHRTRGTATAGGAATLTTDKNWAVNELTDMTLKIVKGTGLGQTRIIASNTVGANSVITVTVAWTTVPDATSEYEVYPDDVDNKRVSRVEKAGLAPTTGIVTFDPAMEAVIENQSDFSFHLLPTHVLLAALRWATENLRHITYSPVSLLEDADFEEEGIDKWPETGGGTRSKITDAINVRRGKRSLRLLNTIADDYVSNLNAVRVGETETMSLSAIVRADVGTAKLVAFNKGGSEIKSRTWTGERFGEINFPFTIPAGGEELEIRLQGAGATDDCYWNIVTLLGQSRTEYPAPVWLTEPEDVIAVGFWPSGSGGPSALADTYRLDESEFHEWHYWDILRDDRAANPFRVVIDPPAGARATQLYVKAWRAYDVLTGDADETTANKEAILTGARIFLRKMMTEGAIQDLDPTIVGVLKALEHEDTVAWARATSRTGGRIETRMRGLRSMQI